MLKKLIAGIASVTLALGMVALTATPASADEDPNVVVCKYSGTPGIDEVLQTQTTVSGSTLGTWDGVTFPFEFADAQSHSIAIGFEGTTATCPAPEGAPLVEEVTEEENGPDPKVFVCKYASTPGEGEVLQTTVTVAGATLGDEWDGETFPFEFADAQGHSVAIGWEGDVTEADCPGGQGPEEDAAASVLVGQPSCEADASVTPSLTNATWSEVLPTAPGGPYTVTAEADEGHAFPGGALTLDVVYSVAGQLDPLSPECDLTTHAPIPTNVTHTDQVCRSGVAGGGTVTVGQILDGDDEGDWFDEVNYFLDGSLIPLASITTAISAGPHVVTAEVKDPDDAIQDGYPSSWEFTVLAPATCDLTTLALTGAGGNPEGWAGLGYYMLVAGLGLIAVRTLRRRNEVNQ